MLLSKLKEMEIMEKLFTNDVVTIKHKMPSVNGIKKYRMGIYMHDFCAS